MERLYAVANEIKGLSTTADIARALNFSWQATRNWEKRGVSRDGMLAAQKMFGVSVTWLETGEGPMLVKKTDESVPLRTANEAQFLVSILRDEEQAALVPLLRILAEYGMGRAATTLYSRSPDRAPAQGQLQEPSENRYGVKPEAPPRRKNKK